MLTALVFVYMIGALISLFYIMYIEPFTPILIAVFTAVCWPMGAAMFIIAKIMEYGLESYMQWEKNRYYKKLNKNNPQ